MHVYYVICIHIKVLGSCLMSVNKDLSLPFIAISKGKKWNDFYWKPIMRLQILLFVLFMVIKISELVCVQWKCTAYPNLTFFFGFSPSAMLSRTVVFLKIHEHIPELWKRVDKPFQENPLHMVKNCPDLAQNCDKKNFIFNYWK